MAGVQDQHAHMGACSTAAQETAAPLCWKKPRAGLCGGVLGGVVLSLAFECTQPASSEPAPHAADYRLAKRTVALAKLADE